MGDITDLAEFQFHDGTVLLLALEDWDEWVPNFEAIRVLRSGEYTEYEYIFLVAMPFVDQLIDEDKYMIYVKTLGHMAKSLMMDDDNLL